MGIPSGQNEPKDQGCKTIGGGHRISATFYQWFITLYTCKLITGRSSFEREAI